jgi:hypothetical protein
MLEYEWRELEALCERLSDLRHRQGFAERSKNSGLVEGLREDIARVTRQREQLVQHISARLGSATAEQSDPAAASGQQSDDATLKGVALEPADGGDADGSFPGQSTGRQTGKSTRQ